MLSEEYVQKLKAMNWPQEFHEKLHVGNLFSNIGIATLWTFQDVVYNKLDPEKYAVVGNFYDRKNALEPFLRNCLANPNLRYIIVVGNDKAKSKEVLLNFFEKGFSDGKVVETETSLPKEIPEEDLKKIRENVILIDITHKIKDQNNSEDIAKAIEEVIATLEKKEPYAEPKFYEKPKIDVGSFPSEKTCFVVRGETVGETWLKVLNEIYNYGAITKMKSTDSTKVREAVNLIAIVSKENPDKPKMESYFRFTEEYLKSYYGEICTDKLPEGMIYTYGSRLRAWQGKDEGKDMEKIDQIQDIIEYLKKDIFRKSALAQTWVVEDELTRRYLNKDKNSPCIILIQPNIQNGALHLTVYIRSNDMFRGWPLNAFGLRKLQKILCEGLGVDMGDLVTISCSAHIYQENWEETKEILGKYFQNTNCFFDPRGYYIIFLQGSKIKLQHYSPDSQLLKEYEGVTARELSDRINSAQHSIDSYHSAYLGEELMKAEVALVEGVEYVQDAPVILKSGKKFGFASVQTTQEVCSTDACLTDLCSTDSQGTC